MPRKMMTNLCYTSRQKCREDCDTLGIDRRRVQSMRDGFTTPMFVDGERVYMPIVARLRVATALVYEVGVDALQNDDGESDG